MQIENSRHRIFSSCDEPDQDITVQACDFFLAKEAYEETLRRVDGLLKQMPRVPQLLSRNHILIEIIYRIQNGVSCKDCLVAYGSKLIVTGSENNGQNLLGLDGKRCHVGASEEQ
ncbi:hypothetical protein [Methylobacterium brachythecii]|uniref:Uncharacterized protein n=1 Tax=Methylobacterium brachythecii TaxID=1176177 RepID=A0A7W6ANY1_9HYPH|nr:hypothetical protein [Methylobacterium brachythecii]MBB3903152.1 hypothetical protein [Methylobacterium brachythecii]GLS44735.1 hypothetical protein GCM10007884_27230 [Methylobacterium brachythecii]